jgi:tetratricopeptide (TPR) repeat protein
MPMDAHTPNFADYYTSKMASANDGSFFVDSALHHPLYTPEKLKSAPGGFDRGDGVDAAKTGKVKDNNEKEKREKEEGLRLEKLEDEKEAYRLPPGSKEWGALDWYQEASERLAAKDYEGFSVCLENVTKQDTSYIPEPNKDTAFFEDKQESWKDNGRTRTGMLAVHSAAKVDRLVLDFLGRGRWFEARGLEEWACADLSYALHFGDNRELWWSRASLARTRTNFNFARVNLGRALQLTKEAYVVAEGEENKRKRDVKKVEDGQVEPNMTSSYLKERVINMLLLHANFSYELNDYDGCVRCTTEALQWRRYGDLGAFAYRQRSLAFAFREEYEKGIEDLERYGEIMPYDLPSKLRKAYMYSIVHQHDKAHLEMKSIIRYAPESPKALYVLALAFYREESWTEAYEMLLKCLTQDQTFWEAFLRMAEVQERLGQLDAAIDTCHHILKKQPQFHGVHRTLGRLHLRVAQRVAEMLTDLEVQVEEKEQKKEEQKTQMEAKTRVMDQAQDKNAEPQKNQRVSVSGKFVEHTSFNTTRTDMSAPIPEVSVARRRSAIKLEGHNFHSQSLLLLKILKQGETDSLETKPEFISACLYKATTSLHKAVAVDPGDGEAHFLLGYSLSFIQGNNGADHHTAQKHVNAGLEHEPGLWSIGYLKAFLLMREGASKHEDAQIQLDKLLSEHGANELALGARAFLYFKSGKEGYTNAKKDYNRLVQMAAQNGDLEQKGVALGHRGLVHLLEGNNLEARVDLLQALSINPNNPLARVYRAECNTKLGHKADAIEDYRAAIVKLASEARHAKADYGLLVADQERRARVEEEFLRVEEMGLQRRSRQTTPVRSRRTSRQPDEKPGERQDHHSMWAHVKDDMISDQVLATADKRAKRGEHRLIAQSLSHFRLLPLPNQHTVLYGRSGASEADLASLGNSVGILLHDKDNKSTSRLYKRRHFNTRGISLRDRDQRADKVAFSLSFFLSLTLFSVNFPLSVSIHPFILSTSFSLSFLHVHVHALLFNSASPHVGDQSVV